MPAAALQAPRTMSYAEFWRRYLGAHRDARTRALHYVDTSDALAALLDRGHIARLALAAGGAGDRLFLAWTGISSRARGRRRSATRCGRY